MVEWVILLAYILVLHWLLYRLHRRQRAHEAVTLGVVKVVGVIATHTAPTGPIEAPTTPGEVH